MDKIFKLVEHLLTRDEIEVLDKYSKPAPDYELDLLKSELKNKGYDLDVVKDNRDNFFVDITKQGNIVNHKVLSKNKLMYGAYKIEDLIY